MGNQAEDTAKMQTSEQDAEELQEDTNDAEETNMEQSNASDTDSNQVDGGIHNDDLLHLMAKEYTDYTSTPTATTNPSHHGPIGGKQNQC